MFISAYPTRLNLPRRAAAAVLLAAALVAPRLCAAADAPAPAPAPNLLSNGSFENGADGWLWEQWDSKPLPGAIDKQEHAQGASSFRMGLPGGSGARYLAQECRLAGEGKDHVLTFWLKGKDLPANAAHVRVGIEGRGWLGSAGGKSEAVQAGGTFDWKQYSVPIPAGEIGDSKKITLFFYDDQVGQGTLWIDGATLKAATEEELADAVMASTAPTLTGDTSHPDLSTFIKDEPVELTFRVSNIGKAADLKLMLEILDEHDKPIEKQELPLELVKRTATASVRARSDKYGFYRVRAKLSDGTQLSPLGTRPAGFLTYCVVPDPALRKDYGEMESRFAMQGGFGPWGEQVQAYLGSRWVLDSNLEWRKNEPDRAGQFAEAIAAGKIETAPEPRRKWQSFPLPTLMAAPQWAVVEGTCPYMTGVLTPEGEKAWVQYCKQAAGVYMKRYPDLQQRIYQITWEPIFPWGFKGRNEDLVRIYELAHKALHDADPRAVVAGPTRGINRNDVQLTIPLLQLGLGKYMDMYSTHPYYSIDAEKDGMPRELRRMKQALDQYSGRKDMPMIGTEQGWTTNEEVDKELTMARGLLRQNLITLGEGYRFNFAYYIVDYHLGEQKGYGYYYNLVSGVPWGPAKASPRPIAPAYAAQSFLLDGHRSVGAIEWLGATTLGYAFQRDADVVLALWDWGDQPRTVSLPTGAAQVRIYDWMGNQRVESGPAGNITLALGPEPVYVAGVSPNIWGDVAGRMLSVDSAQLEAYPGARLRVTGKVRAADKPVSARVILEADARLGARPAPQSISVPAGSTAPYSFEIDVPAGASPATLPLKLTLEQGNTQIAAAGASLHLASPLSILAIDPSLSDAGQRGVAVTLSDEQGKGFEGVLDVEIEGSHQRVPVKLAPKATGRFAVALPQLDIPGSRVCEVKASVSSASGSRFAHAEPINFLRAVRLTKITVNGDAGDWPATTDPTTAVRLAGKEMVVRTPENYRPDLTASLRYGWDDQALYVLAEVNDPEFYQPNSGVNTWRGDCLQLAFNLDPRLREAATGNLLDTNIIRRACEINLAWAKDGVEAFRSVTWNPQAAPMGLLNLDQARAAISRQHGRITYEAAIPWKTLGADAPPKAGSLLGVAATVNDMDSADQKDPTALGLFGGIVPDKNSEKFGLLLLGGK